jgi:uncharacterized protein (DUF2147 family)
VQKSALVDYADRLRRAAAAALLIIGVTFFAVAGTAANTTTVRDAGAWFVDGSGSALQLFNCSGLLCGRIVWLQNARDIAGRPVSDSNNPDPASRRRPLCGLTVLRGLRPVGPGRWNSGSLYNPDDGRTYLVSARLRSADVFIARVYVGMPLFGETKILMWVPRLGSEGRC